MLVRLEHMCYVGIDFLIVTLLCAFAYICGIVGSKRPEMTLRVSREIGSTSNIRIIYVALSGVCLSNYSGYGDCNGGPLTGLK
jgi:hypothetical protein